MRPLALEIVATLRSCAMMTNSLGVSMTNTDASASIRDPTNGTTVSFRSTGSDKLKEYHRGGYKPTRLSHCGTSWYGGANNNATNDNKSTITEIVRRVAFAVRRYFKDTLCWYGIVG